MTTIETVTNGVLTTLGTTADAIGLATPLRRSERRRRGSIPPLRPYPIEGSGTCYVVLLEAAEGWARNPWVTGNRHPRLVVNIYSSNSQDVDGNPIALDAHSKALGVYELIDNLLDGQTQDGWPQVVSCRRDGEPSLHDVPDTEDSVLLSARYELSVIV